MVKHNDAPNGLSFPYVERRTGVMRVPAAMMYGLSTSIGADLGADVRLETLMQR
jgi:hypothetical protein